MEVFSDGGATPPASTITRKYEPCMLLGMYLRLHRKRQSQDLMILALSLSVQNYNIVFDN